jgi:hypothetical protein
MAVGKRGAFAHKAIQVRRFHVIETQFPDRIETLLVCDDEDDVGSGFSHECELASGCWCCSVGSWAGSRSESGGLGTGDGRMQTAD